MTSAAGLRGEVIELIRRVGSGVVATVSPLGSPEAALVGLMIADTGEVIFNSLTHSRKIDHLRMNPRIAIVVTEAARSVQLEGVAVITEGEHRERTVAEYRKERPDSRSAPEIISFVVVRLDWARSYDTRTDPPLVMEGPW